MRIYTVHFNRLIRDQSVLQYKHLWGGILCETPQAAAFMLNFQLCVDVFTETKPWKIKQLFHRKAGRTAAGKVLI